jgi:D-alanyl-D-alanine carboxypeptidase
MNRRGFLAAGAAVAAAPKAWAAPADVRRIEQALQPILAKATTEDGAPGCSAAVLLADDTLITAVAGWADPDARAKMTPATRLMSGSTGKTFCAATAMSLVAEGRLQLDAPIAPIFADEAWYARLPNARDLTLRILLMHEGGFPQFLDDARFQTAVLGDSLLGRDIGYSPRKMLSFILDEKPLSPAGARYHYSDLHYHLAGLTMEKVTGQGYYALLQARVLSKLPTHDILPSTSKDLPGLAAGYARGDLIQALAGNTGKTTDRPGHLRKNPSLEYTGGGLDVAQSLLTWSAPLEAFEGVYASGELAADLYASVSDGQLLLTIDSSVGRQSQLQLCRVGEHEFRLSRAARALWNLEFDTTIVFAPPSDGRSPSVTLSSELARDVAFQRT